MDILEELRRHRIYVTTMNELYGFDKKQAELLENAYKAFDAQNGKYYTNDAVGNMQKINDFYTALACLHSGYSANSDQFKLMGDNNMTPEQAVKYFDDLGVDGEALKEAVVNQHDQCEENGKRDFAHECAMYSVMANNGENSAKSVAGIFDDVNALVGYKGDIYSGKMGVDDIMSDIGAENTYHRMVDCEDGNVWKTMTEYNNGVSRGAINESKEFLERIGGGDAQKGMKKLQKKINKKSLGTDKLSKGVNKELIEAAKEDFLNHISSESGIEWE